MAVLHNPIIGTAGMSDFIVSLRKKRAAFVTEQAELMALIQKSHTRVTDLNGAIAGIDSLLKLEGVGAEKPPSGAAGMPKDFGEALLWLLADHKPRSTQDLADEATNYGVDFEGKNPLRKINFTLLGIRKGGRVQQTADGRWQLPNAQ